MAGHPAAVRAPLARDVYSALHFPVILGVILVAVGVEEAVAHPSDPLPHGGLLALGAGVALFVGGAAAAVARATKRLPMPRMVILAAPVAAMMVWSDASAPFPLLMVVLALVTIAAVERVVAPEHDAGREAPRRSTA